MQKVTFPNKILPYFLLAPQIVLTVVFFFWPASQAIYQSFMREDAFGLKSTFVELANFTAVLSDPNYLHSVQVTVVFNVLTALLAMGVALLLATAADRVIRGQTFYRTLLIWPYAMAPAVAGMLWLFMFNPAMGTFAYLLAATALRGIRFLTATRPWAWSWWRRHGSRFPIISCSLSQAYRQFPSH